MKTCTRGYKSSLLHHLMYTRLSWLTKRPPFDNFLQKAIIIKADFGCNCVMFSLVTLTHFRLCTIWTESYPLRWQTRFIIYYLLDESWFAKFLSHLLVSTRGSDWIEFHLLPGHNLKRFREDNSTTQQSKSCDVFWRWCLNYSLSIINSVYMYQYSIC